jgi:type IV secretory pathway TraG/TraD family ATPase VirD4
MSENLYYERGRQFTPIRELLNRHASLIGQPGFAGPKRWYQVLRWFKANEPLVPRTCNAPSIPWGGFRIPLNADSGHFLAIGGTGSGKSSILNPLMFEVAKHLAVHSGHQLIYDIKGNLLPILVDSGADIIQIDPFDSRGKAWDIGSDLESPADFRQAAHMLVPSPKDEKDPFWTNVTRNVAAAVLESLDKFSPGRWTFSDFIYIMLDPDRIEGLLNRDPDSAALWRSSVGDERTKLNVVAAIRSRFDLYVPVAGLWSRSKETFSIRQWLDGRGGVLLVRNHVNYSAALGPVHRLLFDLAAKRILALSESRQRQIWWFLDEARSLGKLEVLFDLANLSRSKGGHLVLAIQSIEGMHHTYGREHAEEILGQMRNKSYLRVDSQYTAEWIEKQIGQVQYFVEQIGRQSGWSDGKRNTSRSVSHSRRRESLVMASEILQMQPPRAGTVFRAIHDVPDIGLFVNSVPFEEMIAAQPKANSGVPVFIRRPVKHQSLEPWTRDDLKRLDLLRNPDAGELFPSPASNHQIS